IVSKASEDLPEPDKPVTTISLLRGRVRSMFLRLCSRAPLMTIASRACVIPSGIPSSQPASACGGSSVKGSFERQGGREATAQFAREGQTSGRYGQHHSVEVVCGSHRSG